MRAWRSYDGFEGRSSVRTWLYRIATNVCLTAIERRGRRPLPSGLGGPAEEAGGAARGAGGAMAAAVRRCIAGRGPRIRPQSAVSRAGIRLAFVAALQYLSARQRAVLILRDVLEWPAAEVADLLGTTTTAVNSALRRARAQLAQALPAEDELAEPAEPERRAVLDRFAAAIENADGPRAGRAAAGRCRAGDAPAADLVHRPPDRGALYRGALSHRARRTPAGSGHGERGAGVRGLPARTSRDVSRARRAGGHGRRDGNRRGPSPSRTRDCSGRSDWGANTVLGPGADAGLGYSARSRSAG